MKISKGLLSLISYSCLIISFPVIAKTNTSLVSPKKGVICDQYICVNNKGVSKSLTAQYLGTQKANKVFSQGDFDHSAFTFSNGVFCDTNTKRWANSNMRCDSLKSLMIINKLSKFL
ncbi:YcgJ family protein [Pseudomonas aeruginosa]|uniref:YcgJ family protein n=1 Tax=Pseudomonas aeruginosa TaxID=287 RepID=UPI001C3BC5C1|nr:hypothetical protein [Escherichia coli]HBH7025905.1 hypothetical protein [Escherichia coli]